jgi:hypothetical protein
MSLNEIWDEDWCLRQQPVDELFYPVLGDQLTAVHPIDDLLRVSIDVEGRFDIVDFTTPSKSGRVLFKKSLQEDVPTWIIEAVSMLRITDPRSVVHGVGFRLTDKLYYVVDKREVKDEA